MRTPSDTKRRRAVKAEFDPDFQATPMGGAILAEKTLRCAGMMRHIREYLPGHCPHAGFKTSECAYAILAGIMLGGQGMQEAETLRLDKDQARMFGSPGGVPSPPTVYRALCDLSGLSERKEEDWYKPASASLPPLDMFGEESKPKRLHRMVPDGPRRTFLPHLRRGRAGHANKSTYR